MLLTNPLQSTDQEQDQMCETMRSQEIELKPAISGALLLAEILDVVARLSPPQQVRRLQSRRSFRKKDLRAQGKSAEELSELYPMTSKQASFPCC